MSAVRQIGIKMTVDAQSVTTELPRIGREFDNMGSRAEQGAERATRSLARVNMSVRDIVQGAAGLHIVGSAISAITEAITSLPRNAFNFSKELEVSQVGMAGILGSMTAINGHQTDYNQALKISSEYIRKLNDDALRTAASSQELTSVFQALLAPGLSAKMTLEEVRQLTVVGTNAVKSIGLSGAQVVQELRDLVAGGITASGSQLATALGLKDSDIAAAKASSEGLFKFLMDRLQGFKASSEAFNDTLKGKLDSVKEGAIRVASEGMDPLIQATKTALGDVSRLFVTFDENKNASLNPALVNDLKSFSQGLADAASMGRAGISVIWEHRSAVTALATAYGAVKLAAFVGEMGNAISAKREAAQASRLLAVQEAAEVSGNAQVVTSSRAKIAAYLAELDANAARARAEVVTQAAQLATLQTTQEAIVVARAEVVAKLNATRATMAQAEAQIAAARAAGAQSMALALVREGTQALTVAQAQNAALMTELVTLGRQQASVQASIAAATTAQTAAQNAATAATGRLTAAQNAASLSGRAFGVVMGALGGPVGIAIAALTVLIGKLVEARWEAEKTAKVGQSKERVDAALAKGGQAEERDIARLRGHLDSLKEKRDELLLDQKGGGLLDFFFGNDYQVGVDSKLRATDAEIKSITGSLNAAEKATAATSGATGQLSLTVSGAEQAWRKSIDGVKTATAIQQEYNDKLSASKKNFAEFEKLSKASPDFDSAKFKAKQAEQAQAEKALADERDKQIKGLSGGAAAARTQGINAEIAATKHGYKLLAAQTADSLAEVESLHKRGVIGDADALERRTTLQLADIDAQRASLESELALLKGRKDSAKKQADVVGELAELAQKRVNIEAAAVRQQQEMDDQAADSLQKRIDGYQEAARQVQQNLYTAQLDQKEIGKTGAALGALRQARVEEMATALERQAVAMDGIDLSGQASAALRAQAQAQRDLAKTQGYNESAKMVADYTRSIKEANAAVQFEQSLAVMSQRDREIALEQYRIAIDLKHRLQEIDAKNPADAAAAARLKADAEAAAAEALAGAAARVRVREMTRSVEQMDDIFRKGFADMLNQGEGAWKAFNKSLLTSFKTSVADELYKAFAQPFIVPVIASVQGLIGSISGSLGGNIGGLLGSSSNLLGMASNASSLYSLASGNSLLNTAAGWLGLGGGTAAATGMAASLGSGMALAGTSAGLGMTAGVGTGLGLVGGGGLGLTAGSAGAGAIGAGLGTSAAVGGAAAGGLSGALAAVPGWGWAAMGALALLGGSGLFGHKSTQEYGGAAMYSAAAGAQTSTSHGAFGTGFGGVAANDQILANVSGISKSIVGALDATAKSFGKTVGYEAAAGFASDFGDDATWGGLRIALQGKDIVNWDETRTSRWAPKEFASGDEGYKQYLNAVAADVKVAMQSMDLPAWANQILDAANDLDSISAALQRIGAQKALFDSWGQSMEMFKDISGELQTRLLTASGSIEALSTNVGAFYQGLYSEPERMAAVQRQMRESLSGLGIGIDPAMGELAKQQFKATVEAAMQGGQAELAAQLMAMSQTFLTAADYAQKAADDSVKRLNEIMGQQHMLYADLAEAEGDYATAAQRRYWIETAGMNQAEQAAYDYIAAIRQQVSAAKTMKQLSDSQWSLENELLTAQGNNSEVARRQRERDLAEMTKGLDAEQTAKIAAAYDYNVALRAQVEAQRAANEAAAAQAQAAQQSAEAARTALKEWQSTTDGIFNEVRRIRGLDAGNAAQSLTAAQTEFAIAQAQARAGDQDAAKRLPELSRAMLALAEGSATSLIELRRIQGQTAASLSNTGGLLASQHGLQLPDGYVPNNMLAVPGGGVATPAAPSMNQVLVSVAPATTDPRMVDLLTRMLDTLDDIEHGTRSSAVDLAGIGKYWQRVLNPSRSALRTDPLTSTP